MCGASQSNAMYSSTEAATGGGSTKNFVRHGTPNTVSGFSDIPHFETMDVGFNPVSEHPGEIWKDVFGHGMHVLPHVIFLPFASWTSLPAEATRSDAAGARSSGRIFSSFRRKSTAYKASGAEISLDPWRWYPRHFFGSNSLACMIIALVMTVSYSLRRRLG